MKKAMIALFLLLTASGALGLKLDSHTITINIDDKGLAQITEEYGLRFASPFEFQGFKEEAKENSSSLLAWQADHDFFFPHFGEQAGNRVNTSTVTFDDNAKALTLKYDLRNSFARLMRQEQRADYFAIDDSRFGAFIESGAIVIPQNTMVRMLLPPNTEVDSSRLPRNVNVQGNTISFGSTQTNALNISYIVVKPIAPTSETIGRGLSDFYIAAIPISVLILIGVYVKREEIGEKIENYIVEHSEMQKREPEEEIDLDA